MMAFVTGVVTYDRFANCVCAHMLQDHYVSTSRTGRVIIEECLHPDCLANKGATPSCLHFRPELINADLAFRRGLGA